jgi:hypothetical protein
MHEYRCHILFQIIILGLIVIQIMIFVKNKYLEITIGKILIILRFKK